MQPGTPERNPEEEPLASSHSALASERNLEEEPLATRHSAPASSCTGSPTHRPALSPPGGDCASGTGAGAGVGKRTDAPLRCGIHREDHQGTVDQSQRGWMAHARCTEIPVVPLDALSVDGYMRRFYPNGDLPQSNMCRVSLAPFF